MISDPSAQINLENHLFHEYSEPDFTLSRFTKAKNNRIRRLWAYFLKDKPTKHLWHFLYMIVPWYVEAFQAENILYVELNLSWI